LNDGRPFPDRDLLLLCAYVVVLVTLVGQGVTFGPLLRQLGLHVNAAEAVGVRNDARLASLAAAGEAVGDMQADDGLPAHIADSLRRGLRQREERLRARISLLEESDADDGWSPELRQTVRAQHQMIDAQREEFVRWRDSGRLSDESMRQLQRE